MRATAFLSVLGAAFGAAVAVVWRIGARSDRCALISGSITPICERPGPSAVAVLGCVLVGGVLTGGATWQVLRAGRG